MCSVSTTTIRALFLSGRVEFVDRARIDLPRFAMPCATPFPNTGLYRRLEAEGRLLHKNWALYDVEHVVSQPKQMSPERLQEGLEWSWRQSYGCGSLGQRLLGALVAPAALAFAEFGLSILRAALAGENRNAYIAIPPTWPKWRPGKPTAARPAISPLECHDPAPRRRFMRLSEFRRTIRPLLADSAVHAANGFPRHFLMRLTLIYPSVGRKENRPYVRAWQMEPLSMAVLASLTPADVEVRFFDDRMEPIDFDEPTDLVAISVETFTAMRAYKIARQFRQRGVPVVMGATM